MAEKPLHDNIESLLIVGEGQRWGKIAVGHSVMVMAPCGTETDDTPVKREYTVAAIIQSRLDDWYLIRDVDNRILQRVNPRHVVVEQRYVAPPD